MRTAMFALPLLLAAAPALAQNTYGGIVERTMRDQRAMDQHEQACLSGSRSACDAVNGISRSWERQGARADAQMRNQQFQDHASRDLHNRQERQRRQDWASHDRQQEQQAAGTMRGARTPGEVQYYGNQAQHYREQARLTEPQRARGWWPW